MTTFPPDRALLRVFAALALAVSLSACKELTEIDASYANVTATDTAYALNGSPPNAPNSIKFFDGIVDHADQGFAFDVAFDIDASGNVKVIPARALATSFTGPYSVALQKSDKAFAALLEAPKDGYKADTTVVLGAGETVIAESRDNQACQFSLKGQAYYSKIVIDEIDLPKRRIVFTVTVNRNCGFRSFEPGIPRD
jgi:hypothetical protein